jgi:hypothetical protein
VHASFSLLLSFRFKLSFFLSLVCFPLLPLPLDCLIQQAKQVKDVALPIPLVCSCYWGQAILLPLYLK